MSNCTGHSIQRTGVELYMYVWHHLIHITTFNSFENGKCLQPTSMYICKHIIRLYDDLCLQSSGMDVDCNVTDSRCSHTIHLRPAQRMSRLKLTSQSWDVTCFQLVIWHSPIDGEQMVKLILYAAQSVVTASLVFFSVIAYEREFDWNKGTHCPTFQIWTPLFFCYAELF